jgi:rod shape-determining protein MreC
VRSLIPLVALILVSITLSVIHNRAVSQRRPSPVTAPILAALAPGQRIVSQARQSAMRVFGASGDTPEAENQRLKAQIEALKAENARLTDEVKSLNRLLKLRDAFPSSLPAKLISLGGGSWAESATLNRGSRDGVRPKDIVVTEAGVAGQVTSMIGPDSSVALFLTDPASGIGARTQPSGAIGVARGDGSPMLNLTYLDKTADVKKGDDVFSSGLGGVFPAGYFIGRVIEVKTDPSGAGRTASIQPSVDFSRLDDALILRSATGP